MSLTTLSQTITGDQKLAALSRSDVNLNGKRPLVDGEEPAAKRQRLEEPPVAPPAATQPTTLPVVPPAVLPPPDPTHALALILEDKDGKQTLPLTSDNVNHFMEQQIRALTDIAATLIRPEVKLEGSEGPAQQQTDKLCLLSRTEMYLRFALLGIQCRARDLRSEVAAMGGVFCHACNMVVVGATRQRCQSCIETRRF
ncbi:Hypothetical protein POVN_LOCUS694 [uncultured virus]|nr:Hypothetical protein POVN_LOCUS694 [uncultured virus]